MRNRISRRKFLSRGTLAMTAAASGTVLSHASPAQQTSKVIKIRDPQCCNAAGTAMDETRIHEMVDRAVMAITGQTQKSAAYEALFPQAVTASTRIAIKTNGASAVKSLSNSIVVQGLVNGLTSMLNNTFPGNNIKVSTGGSNLIRESNPEFDVCKHRYRIKDEWVDADWIINCPVCWAHWDRAFGVTLGLKNLMSAVGGAPLTPMHDVWNSPDCAWLSVLNSQPVFRDKIVLTLTDAVTGRVQDGPGRTPDFTAHTLMAYKDMVAGDYQGMLLLKEQGLSADREEKARTVFSLAAGDPWKLGTDDPAQMTVVTLEPPYDMAIQVPGSAAENMGLKVQLSPNPSPYAVQFTLQSRGTAGMELKICDAKGMLVWQKTALTKNSVRWPGVDRKGVRVPNGTYVYSIISGAREAGGSIQIFH